MVRRNRLLARLRIASGIQAEILCAGRFLSGRAEGSILAEDLGFHPLFRRFRKRTDSHGRSVTADLAVPGLFRKKAVFLAGLGAVLLDGRAGESVRNWDPRIPVPLPDHPDRVPWPTGDLLPEEPSSARIDRRKMDAAAEAVFAEPDPRRLRRTRAVVVVHDGRLVAERYAPGFDKDMPQLGWSMSKCVTNALVGILAGQGRLDVRAPAPVPEWQRPGDPRRTITIDQLLRMSSGLRWTQDNPDHAVSDESEMLFDRADMAAFAASKLLRDPPDTVFEYSSGTSLLLSRIVRHILSDQGEYWAFPRRALFNRIGMRRSVFQPDASGTFVGSSYVYATARDWARFGLLYLNDGVWEGERILPEGWVAYTRTPSPTAKDGEYGAHFRLNGGSVAAPDKRMYPRVPPDAFFCRGYQGQLTAIIPSRRLVVVRMGMTWDGEWGGGDFLADVIDAVESPTAAPPGAP
jgi:CubicO group peptidase (beta-lactamase class C family)